MRRGRLEISVQLTRAELRFLCRALSEAADAGLISRNKATRRIGRLTMLALQAEDAQQSSEEVRKRISERTLAGLERQRETGQPGPAGFFGPGRPRAKIDAARASALRDRGLSYTEIAELIGVSRSTIARHFKREADVPQEKVLNGV